MKWKRNVAFASQLIVRSIDALMRHDTKLADAVVRGDEGLDALEIAVEERAVLIIAKRQPMARDLRNIMVAIRIASDIERRMPEPCDPVMRTCGMMGEIVGKAAYLAVLHGTSPRGVYEKHLPELIRLAELPGASIADPHDFLRVPDDVEDGLDERERVGDSAGDGDRNLALHPSRPASRC